MKARVLLTTAALVALSAAPAYAAAGGGSSGFSGGGGDGGGGGGGSFWILILFFLIDHPIAGLAVLAIVALIGVWLVVDSARYKARREKRAERVRLAAAEASEDDAAFDPETVMEQAKRLFTDIQNAWDKRDLPKLGLLVGPDLMVEWHRRLADFQLKGWHNKVRIDKGPKVEYLGMVNRADDRDDRVVVRVDATLEDFVEDSHGKRIEADGSANGWNFLTQYWTLGKRESDGKWILLSIEEDEEGKHNLAEDLVVTPWDDTARLRDEALVEGATADKLPENVKASEVASVSYEHDARAKALDLSLADARFGPDVLEVAVRRVVAAWAEAVDGSDDALAAISSARAFRDLLHPNDPSKKTRLVVRGPKVTGVTIEALDVDTEPPRMTVSVQAEGARYIEDRDTAAVLSGSRSIVAHFTERWTLALDGGDANPWRIVDARAAARPAEPQEPQQLSA
jgi:predicted lipid-binding transport protein (Tim44 family)